MGGSLSGILTVAPIWLFAFLLATPSQAQHGAQSGKETFKQESLLGAYEVVGRTEVLSFSGRKVYLQKGDAFEALDDVGRCFNAKSSPTPPCAFGQLIQLGVSSQNTDLVGDCFCTSPVNIRAQNRIPFSEDGVEVVIPPEDPDEEQPPPPPAPAPKPVPPPPKDAKTQGPDPIETRLRQNACNKVKIAPDIAGRVQACLARQKKRRQRQDPCRCSALRCSQFVKLALGLSHVAGHANDPAVKSALEGQGWLKCSNIKSAEAAPSRAVIFYDSRVRIPTDPGSPYGHIEYKTDKNTYISDFESSVPRTSYGATVKIKGKRYNNRKVSAVYVKPPQACR